MPSYTYGIPSRFTTFLQSPIPFSRRSSNTTISLTSTTRTSSSSSTSSQSTDPSEPSNSPSTPPSGSLSGSSSLIRCAKCLEHLCPISCIISKGFTGRHGRAYLVSAAPSGTFILEPNTSVLPNVIEDHPESRLLVTGYHSVASIKCFKCGQELGWKYKAAQEDDQQYKVGKYILETKMIVRISNWENRDDESGPADTDWWRKKTEKNHFAEDYEEEEEDEIVFDSQDEDECEDLFLGVWSEKLAMKRRRDKLWKQMR